MDLYQLPAHSGDRHGTDSGDLLNPGGYANNLELVAIARLAIFFGGLAGRFIFRERSSLLTTKNFGETQC
jgi:hypothetical protein